MNQINAVTEAQASYIRDLVAKIEARQVAGPKKTSRWNDPVAAHGQHIAKARRILAELDAGTLTMGAASTHIPALKLWAGQ